MVLKPENGCMFCGWIQEKNAVEGLDTAAAFEDGFPVTPGHLLIMPLRHVADGLSMTEEEVRDSLELLRFLTRRIRQSDPAVTGFNIGMNIGRSAGQTMFHAHIHLIPRREGDCDEPRGGVRGVIDGKRSY